MATHILRIQRSSINRARHELSKAAGLAIWEFAQIFGNAMFMGQTKTPFFVDNEIELIEDGRAGGHKYGE